MLPTMIIIIYITFLFVWFKIRINKTKVPYRDDFENFMSLDRKANMTRRKEIPAEYFVYPDISNIPMGQYDGTEYQRLASKQESLVKASKLKMIRFDRKMSNLELKSMYGAGVIEEITRYEDNYNSYLRALVNYANELIKCGFLADAETVLLEGVNFGSDLMQSYMLLADVYLARGKKDELNGLLDLVLEQGLWNNALTEKVTGYIKNKIESGE